MSQKHICIPLSVAVSLCATTHSLLIASFGGTERPIGSTTRIVGLLCGCMFPHLLIPATP